MGAKEDRKECYFRILRNYTKRYNKWYPDSENQEWTKSIGKGKYRVCARMVQFDHSFGTYKDVNPVSSQWAQEFIHVLCDEKDITRMHGILERDIGASGKTAYAMTSQMGKLVHAERGAVAPLSL